MSICGALPPARKRGSTEDVGRNGLRSNCGTSLLRLKPAQLQSSGVKESSSKWSEDERKQATSYLGEFTTNCRVDTDSKLTNRELAAHAKRKPSSRKYNVPLVNSGRRDLLKDEKL